MLMEEFTALTGYKPSPQEYEQCIEPMYMDFDGDKEKFCHLWGMLFANRVKRQKSEQYKQEKYYSAAFDQFKLILDTTFGILSRDAWNYARAGMLIHCGLTYMRKEHTSLRIMNVREDTTYWVLFEAQKNLNMRLFNYSLGERDIVLTEEVADEVLAYLLRITSDYYKAALRIHARKEG